MNRRILIVEDDPVIRMLSRTVLEGDGYEVFEAVDGPSAAPAAREHKPDAVLLDIGLPGMDGFGVLGVLKDDPELRDIPVLMVTAWAEPELVAKALDRGAHDYIRKPFDIGDLRARVDAAIRGADNSDAATGLPGRSRLTEELERQIASARRTGRSFSVVVVALDSEELSDPTLYAVGRRLGQRVRGADVLGRWGYGTFVVVAPDTALGGAGALAEDLRAALADRALATADGGRRITASVGVAEHRGVETYEGLLQRAAAAVTAAHLSGRNTVRLADEADAVVA